MNKKFKVVSSIALAGLLTLNVFSVKTLATEVNDTIKTNPVGIFRELVDGKKVVPFVVTKDASKNIEDYVTVNEVVNSKEFSGLKITKFNTSNINTINENTIVRTGDTFTVDGETDPYTIIVYGDVNRDGKVNSSDAATVLRAATGKETLDDIQKEAADVQNNGQVKSADASVILRYAVGKGPAIDKVPDTEKMETKLDKIYTDGNSTKIDMTFNTNPNGFRYTLINTADNSEIAVTPTINEDNKVTLATTSLLDVNKVYTITVTDKNGNKIKEETFTYRNIKAVDTVNVENAKGINANNQKELTLTVSASKGKDTFDKTVVVTLTDTDNQTVEFIGNIINGLVDTKVTADVSSLKDGLITVTTKTYDNNGNTVEAKSRTTILKGVTPSALKNIETKRLNYTDAEITFEEIATTNKINLSTVYYKILEEGTKAPSVDEIVEENKTATLNSGKWEINTKDLTTDNMYYIYMVTENNVDTRSEVIVAPIAKDGISEKLDKVKNIKSNGNGSFSWEDSQNKVTGYKVQLAKDGTILAETTVTNKEVDFTDIIKEQDTIGKYTINVIAIGDYKTIDNSDSLDGDINKEEQTLNVEQLKFASVAVSKLNDTTMRITVTNDVDDRASGIKIEILKGAMIKNTTGTETFQFVEENKVYSEVKNVTDRWYDINTSNFKDGAYQVKVTAIKDASDIKLLNSVAKVAAPIYSKITNGVELFEINSQDITKDSATITIAPFELDGFEAKYNIKCVALNSNGEEDKSIPVKELNDKTINDFTEVEKTSLRTLKIEGLQATTKYRVSLEVVPAIIKNVDKDIFVSTDISKTFTKSIDIETKANPITPDEYTVVKFGDIEEELTEKQIAISKDGSKLLGHGDNGNVELKGSNAEQIKAIVAKLDTDDTIEIKATNEITVSLLKANIDTRTINFENTIKDCNLKITGQTNQLTKVFGDLGKGSVTLNGAGEINVQGLTSSNNEIIVADNGLKVAAAIGTTVTLDNKNGKDLVIVNGVKVSGVAEVVITGTNTLSIPTDGKSAIIIDTDLNKEIVFTGTQGSGKVTINSTGTNNKITIKTANQSKIEDVEVNATSGATIDLSGAYIKSNIINANIDTQKLTLITSKEISIGDMKIIPNDSAITIVKGISGITVTGNTKIEYTDKDNTDTPVTTDTKFEEEITLKNNKKVSLSPKGEATYTWQNNLLTINLMSGTITVKEK